MAILSFRKLVASIFIFLSTAGLLFTLFGLLTDNSDDNMISKFVIYITILGAAYYMGYIYEPKKSVSVDAATCNSLAGKKRGKTQYSNSSSGLYSDYAAPDSKEAQVFNISDNIFRYDQAAGACKKFGAKVATVDQLKEAYKQGANWCNYGWTEGGYALYPIQPGYFNSIQSSESCKWKCGPKPGIVGGTGEFKLKNSKSMTLGVNCYGVPPPAEDRKEVVLDCQRKNAALDDALNKISKDDMMVNTFN